jgi:cytochrome c
MVRIVVFLCVLAAYSLALSAEAVSLDKGSEIFSSSQPGSNGKSCSSCHPDGKGLRKAENYSDDSLVGIINKCITGALQGKALDPNSAEMKSLQRYIKYLAPINQQ